MSKPMQGRHFITTQEWTDDEIELLLETSWDLKRKFYRDEPHALLRDKTLFMMFYEQSTRTRNCFEAGMTQLGGHAHDLTPDKLQVSHGETAEDTARVLSRMGHGISIRNCDWGVGNKFIRSVAADEPRAGDEHAVRPLPSLPGGGRPDDHPREISRRASGAARWSSAGPTRPATCAPSRCPTRRSC